MLTDAPKSLLGTSQGGPSFPKSELLRKSLDDLRQTLKEMEQVVVPDALDRTKSFSEILSKFSVNVSLLGQVKAGKTALTNAMIGMPEMLPSDVNPWTSVVTSIHLNTPKPRGQKAVFTFFNQDEWSSMVEGGGRMAELALRADFEEEFEQMQGQVRHMQEQTEQRLGKNFALLIGRAHGFSEFSSDLVKRYVCLGDDDVDGPNDGRFANMTKSADLYSDDPAYPLPMVIQDTPGVNDPFLIRETVTLDNLVQSDVCVIVLSAHQAFSTVDIALMRVLLALKHKQIVLFINRIDELPDPHKQISEIDGYIRELLVDQGLSPDIPIVFGSAEWGQAACVGLDDYELLEDSADTLERLAADRLAENDGEFEQAPMAPGTTLSSTTKIHDLSGLNELKAVLDEKAADELGFPFVSRLRTQALDVLNQSAMLLEQNRASASPVRADLDLNEFIDHIDDMLKSAQDYCDRLGKKCTEQIIVEMSAAYHDFIDTEKRALANALNRKGGLEEWSPDTEGLRRALNLAYTRFGETGKTDAAKLMDQVANNVSDCYSNILVQDSQLFAVMPPEIADPKTPSSLMKTMSIDLSGSWLGNWFKKRLNKSAYVDRFTGIVMDEMQHMIAEIQNIYIADFLKNMRLSLHGFLSEHVSTLQSLSALEADEQRAEMRRKLGMENQINQRLIKLEQIKLDLQNLPTSSEIDVPAYQTAAE